MSIPILLALIVLVPAALVAIALALPVAGARFVSYVLFPVLLVVVAFARTAVERGRS